MECSRLDCDYNEKKKKYNSVYTRQYSSREEDSENKGGKNHKGVFISKGKIKGRHVWNNYRKCKDEKKYVRGSRRGKGGFKWVGDIGCRT